MKKENNKTIKLYLMILSLIFVFLSSIIFINASNNKRMLTVVKHQVSETEWTNKDVDVSMTATNENGFETIINSKNEKIDFRKNPMIYYGNSKNESFNSVRETKDGGFICVGEQRTQRTLLPGQPLENYDFRDGDGLIVKYDKFGKVQWSTLVKQNDNLRQVFWGVTEFKDTSGKVKGYVAVGETHINQTKKEGFIAIVSANGSLVETRTLSTPTNGLSVYWNAIQDSSNRILVVGTTYEGGLDGDGIVTIIEFPYGIYDFTDKKFETDRPNSNYWVDIGYDYMIEKEGDGYYIVGSYRNWHNSSNEYGNKLGVFIKLDYNFNLVLQKLYEPSMSDKSEYVDLDSMIVSNDGNIIISGDYKSPNTIDIQKSSKDAAGLLMKVNPRNGNIIWQTNVDGTGAEQIYSLTEVNINGNYKIIATGFTSSDDYDFGSSQHMGAYDAFIGVFDSNTGALEDDIIRIGGPKTDCAYWVITTKEGLPVIVGATSYNDVTNTSKNDSDGFIVILNTHKMFSERFTVTENSTYTYKFIDIFKNETTYTIEIKNIDKYNPLEPSITYTGTDVKTITIKDNGDFDGPNGAKSGIKKIMYRIDNGSWVDYSSPFRFTDEVGQIYAKAIDNAGNESGEVCLYIGVEKTDYIVSNGKYIDTNNKVVDMLSYENNYSFSFDVSNKPLTPFVKMIGGTANESIYGLIETKDNGYAIVGEELSNNGDFLGMNKGKEDCFVMKLDNEGRTIWKTTIGGSNSDYGRKIIEDDDDFIVVGFTSSNDGDFLYKKSDNITSGFIARIDGKTGRILMLNVDQINESTTEIFYTGGLCKTSDGGYLVTAQRGTGNLKYAATLIKYTRAGQIEWRKYFGGTTINGEDLFEAVIESHDGNIIAIGRGDSTNSPFGNSLGGQDAYIVKYDKNGNIIWQKRFGGSGNETFRHIAKTDDKGYIVVGYTTSKDGQLSGIKNNGTSQDALIVKYNEQGDVVWAKTYGSANDIEYLLAIQKDKDGNFITSGFGGSLVGDYRNIQNNGKEDALVMKLNPNGNLIWGRNFGGSQSECLRQIVVLADGGYAIAGNSNSNDYDVAGLNKGADDALLVKFNEDGTLTLKQHDEQIDKIEYTLQASDGKNVTTIKSGKFNLENLAMHETKTKEIPFALPTNMTNIREVTAIIELSDHMDLKLDNNRIVVSIEVEGNQTDTDYAILEERIENSNGTKQSSLDYDINYKLKFNVKNSPEKTSIVNYYDEFLSTINYKIQAKSGNDLITLKQGTYSDEYIPIDRFITKEIDFKISKKYKIQEIICTIEIIDNEDTNSTNNKVIMKVPVNEHKEDFAIASYNIKNTSTNTHVGSLSLGSKYNFSAKITNDIVKVIANKMISFDENLDSLSIKIYSSDGIDEKNKKLIAQKTKNNISIKSSTFIWENLEFTVPNDKNINEIIINVEIKDENDCYADNNTLSVTVPVFKDIENDVGFEDIEKDITIYPVGDNNTNTNTDDCYVKRGEYTTIKAKVSSTNIKTQNLIAKLYVNGKMVRQKTVYGVSSDVVGAVYFTEILDEYISANKDTVKIQVKIEPPEGTKEYFENEIYQNNSKEITIKISKPNSPSNEDKYLENSIESNLKIGEAVGYIKVKKIDKSKVVEVECDSPCQEDENGTKLCPKHKQHVYDEGKPYDAFIPIETYSLENIEQISKITSIKYRSKFTKDMVGKTKYNKFIDGNGFVEILDSNGNMKKDVEPIIRLKAGYGFELETTAEYTNNLPSVYKGFKMQNKKITETQWSKFENYPGDSVKLIYNNVDENVKKESKNLIGVVVPAMDEIGIYYPTELFLRTPSKNEYLSVGDGMKSIKDKYPLEITPNGNLYKYQKQYKLSTRTLIDTNKYYVRADVANGKYDMKLFVPRAGLGNICDTSIPKVNSIFEFKIDVYGGYLDDLKTHLNE